MTEALTDAIADLIAAATKLGQALHPRTAGNLAASRLSRSGQFFMSGLFEIDALAKRLRTYVERSDALKSEAVRLLEEALIRGEFERGEIARITGLPERSARRVLKDVIDAGLLASDTPKGAVSLRFPADTLDVLFPRLFPES